MRTTKRTIIDLDNGDTIEIRYNNRAFVVETSELHSAGPTIRFPAGAETIGDPRQDMKPINMLAARLIDDLENGMVVGPNGRPYDADDEEVQEVCGALRESLLDLPLPRGASIFV